MNSHQTTVASGAGVMPSVENPFEDVLTEKEWSKARDNTGLTAGLTE
jgi:hypothetical protein